MPPVMGDEEESLGLLRVLLSLASTADLETFLGEVARLAARSVEPTASCGIIASSDGHPVTVVTSDSRAALVDEQQYSAGDGPCLQAMRTGVLVKVPDQDSDVRWPGYRVAALELGVKCVLSVPLWVDGTPRGAMGLFGLDHPRTFGASQVRRAEMFAAEASAALALWLRHRAQNELTEQLEQALTARSAIDQAIGLLMGVQRCNADTAFDILREHSQNNNRKVREVAAELVQQMTGHPPAVPRGFEPPD